MYLRGDEICIGRVYYKSGYEAWQLVHRGECEGSDGYIRFFVTMIRISDNSLRTVLECTFKKKWKLYQN